MREWICVDRGRVFFKRGCGMCRFMEDFRKSLEFES